MKDIIFAIRVNVDAIKRSFFDWKNQRSMIRVYPSADTADVRSNLLLLPSYVSVFVFQRFIIILAWKCNWNGVSLELVASAKTSVSLFWRAMPRSTRFSPFGRGLKNNRRNSPASSRLVITFAPMGHKMKSGKIQVWTSSTLVPSNKCIEICVSKLLWRSMCSARNPWRSTKPKRGRSSKQSKKFMMEAICSRFFPVYEHLRETVKQTGKVNQSEIVALSPLLRRPRSWNALSVYWIQWPVESGVSWRRLVVTRCQQRWSPLRSWGAGIGRCCRSHTRMPWSIDWIDGDDHASLQEHSDGCPQLSWRRHPIDQFSEHLRHERCPIVASTEDSLSESLWSSLEGVFAFPAISGA